MLYHRARGLRRYQLGAYAEDAASILRVVRPHSLSCACSVGVTVKLRVATAIMIVEDRGLRDGGLIEAQHRRSPNLNRGPTSRLCLSRVGVASTHAQSDY